MQNSFQEAKWRKGLTTSPEKVSGLFYLNSGETQTFNLPSMTIGPIELENAIVTVPAAGEKLTLFEKRFETGARLGRNQKAQGLLGFDVIKHFVVTIDYKGGHVHIFPGEKNAQAAN